MTPDSQLCFVRQIISSLTADVMGRKVKFRVARDIKRPHDGRIFVQCTYRAKCTVKKAPRTWHGRKWYLSDHMTDDEIVKTCYAAFKATVEHEIMEGFLFEGKRVFNPHINFRALLEVTDQEIYRTPQSPSAS